MRRTLRAHVEAFTGRAEETSPEAIRGAIARADFDEALARAIAGVEVHGRLPVEVALELAPDATSVSGLLLLVAVAERGGLAGALVDLVERDGMPLGVLGRDLAVTALWVAWRLGDREELRARVVREARLRVRGTFGDESAPLVVDLVRELGDAGLRGMAGKLSAPGDAAVVAAAARHLEMTAAEVVAALPPDEPTRAVHGFTVRVAPRPGRNEPCPCGSGKKYKKCCADKDDATVASPVAGLGWDDYLQAGASTMTVEDVEGLPLADLARVDLARLDHPPRVAALRRFTDLRRWDHAARVLETMAAVGTEHLDGYRADMIAGALAAGELDVARGVREAMDDPEDIAEGDRVQLALADRPDEALVILEGAARRALRVEEAEPGRAVELAYGVLDTAPALGILLARAVIGTGHPLDVETLLEEVEDARIRLDLPEGDPGWEVWSALDESDAEEAAAPAPADDGERTRLAGALTAAQRRASELERQLQGLRKELDAPAPAAAPAATEPAERRALRERIETLEAMIREGNEERQGLRKQLAAASSGPRRDEAPARTEEEPDDDGEALAETPRGVLVPRFARAAEDALGDVPVHVASEALRTVGQLAAGDAFAWSRVKQAQDLRPPLLMARVGIHHRLLFRAEAGRAEILDLVTRENLMHTLRRLRR